mgnify:CR=1 FL=1
MKGQCVCGQISYEVAGPINNLYQCHCSICQKQTGSATQTGFFVNTEDFNWLSGKSLISNYSKESGYSVSFCSKCGSTVPNMFRTGEKYWVPAGAFDNLGGAEIQHHIFVANKAEWDEIGGEANQHEEFFPVYE